MLSRLSHNSLAFKTQQESIGVEESTDTQPQTIAATLAMYNGFLDLPLPKMPCRHGKRCQ